MTQPIFIRVYEIPARYGVSRDTIYRAVNKGKLQLHKFGRTSLIRCADLEALITGAAEQPEKSGG